MALVISGPDAGAVESLAHTEVVSAPSLLVQAQHGLGFVPAGVMCVDPEGQIVEPAKITNPQLGITEVTFGFPFTGTVYLS
jgi:hypothetical protein